MADVIANVAIPSATFFYNILSSLASAATSLGNNIFLGIPFAYRIT